MSIETPSWKTGAAQASVSRRAIVFRVGVMVTTSTSPAGSDGHGRRRGASHRSRLDVLRDDAPVRPGAGERGQVDAALARDPARERRCLDPAARGLAAEPAA